jgi:hypothetical protein
MVDILALKTVWLMLRSAIYSVWRVHSTIADNEGYGLILRDIGCQKVHTNIKSIVRSAKGTSTLHYYHDYLERYNPALRGLEPPLEYVVSSRILTQSG